MDCYCTDRKQHSDRHIDSVPRSMMAKRSFVKMTQSLTKWTTLCTKRDSLTSCATCYTDSQCLHATAGTYTPTWDVDHCCMTVL